MTWEIPKVIKIPLMQSCQGKVSFDLSCVPETGAILTIHMRNQLQRIDLIFQLTLN